MIRGKEKEQEQRARERSREKERLTFLSLADLGDSSERGNWIFGLEDKVGFSVGLMEDEDDSGGETESLRGEVSVRDDCL
jgi:hypothetical protein